MNALAQQPHELVASRHDRSYNSHTLTLIHRLNFMILGFFILAAAEDAIIFLRISVLLLLLPSAAVLTLFFVVASLATLIRKISGSL